MSFISGLVAALKGVSALKKLVDTFFSAWINYDIKRIRDDFKKQSKEEIKLLEALKRAKQNRDKEALIALRRQLALVRGEQLSKPPKTKKT